MDYKEKTIALINRINDENKLRFLYKIVKEIAK